MHHDSEPEAVAAMLLELRGCCQSIQTELCKIDSRFGDGDHGITMNKIARLITGQVPQWGDRSIPAFLEDLGMAAMEVRGGSAGPLYGALISGLGVLLEEDENELDEGGLRRMFAGILQELGILPRQKWETRP